MNELLNVKAVNITPPAVGVDDGAFTTASVDTKGFDFAQIIVHLGNVPANLAALKVQESDDDGSADAYADVTGLIVGTSANIDGSTSTLPTAAAGDNKIVIFDIDLRGRERYLDLVATAGDGSGTETGLSAMCLLSKANISPSTVAGRGATEVLAV